MSIQVVINGNRAPDAVTADVFAAIMKVPGAAVARAASASGKGGAGADAGAGVVGGAGAGAAAGKQQPVPSSSSSSEAAAGTFGCPAIGFNIITVNTLMFFLTPVIAALLRKQK